MSNIYADLHLHSTASDGVLSPAELVGAVKLTGLSVLGLTDHDTVKGVAPAATAAAAAGLEFVPGIEFSCGWPDCETPLHIIGLFLDPEAPALTKVLEEQLQARFHRAFKILDLLDGLGVNMDALREEFARDRDKILGRPHIARHLVTIGAVGEFQEAFEKYLRRGAPAYVPKPFFLPEEGIAAIHRAGGGAFIAHPGLIPDWDAIWAKVCDLAWDGLEVLYAEHSPEQTAYFQELTKQRGFLRTGGSDYHGEYGKHASRLGAFGLDQRSFLELKEGIYERRKRRGAMT